MALTTDSAEVDLYLYFSSLPTVACYGGTFTLLPVAKHCSKGPELTFTAATKDELK